MHSAGSRGRLGGVNVKASMGELLKSAVVDADRGRLKALLATRPRLAVTPSAPRCPTQPMWDRLKLLNHSWERALTQIGGPSERPAGTRLVRGSTGVAFGL